MPAPSSGCAPAYTGRMAFTPKSWQNAPNATTPLSAAALIDLETRLSAYTDLVGLGGPPALVVAATGAPTAVKNRADYVCDGTADDVEINAAIAAGSTSYGAVILSAGVFTVDAMIEIDRDNFTLWGQGRATTIKRSASFSGSYMIKVHRTSQSRPAARVRLEGFRIDGQGLGTQDTTVGIYMQAYRSVIREVQVQTVNSHGIHILPFSSWNAYGTFVRNCRITDCGGAGAKMASADTGIEGCEISNCCGPGVWASDPIQMIQNCYIWSNMDNSAATRKGRGILLDGGSGRVVISGNKIEQNRGGIEFVAGSGFIVTDNIFASNSYGANGPPSAQDDGVQMPSGWMAAAGKARNQEDDMYMNGSSGGAPYGSVITNNLFSGTYANDSARYNITINTGTLMVIRNNWFSGGDSGVLNWTTGDNFYIIEDNYGYKTEGRGTATITSATTSVVVTHGLARQPSIYDISLTMLENPTTDVGNIWVSGISSTQFTINCRTAPGASNLDVGWVVSMGRRGVGAD